MTRDEFFAKKSKGALWDVGVSINRTNPLPLDKNAVFESEEALDSYISGVLSYPGQPVAVVTADETKFYILGYDENGALTKQEVGKPTKGDNASIVLDEDSKTLSLKGFTAANKDKIASIALEGDKPVLTWVNNSQAELNADLSGVKSDITNLKQADKDINTRIDNLGTVLNFVGTLSVSDFGKTTDSNGIITNTNYKLGNVVLVGKEEYVAINTTYYKLTTDEIIQSNKTYYSKGSDGTYTAVTDPASTNPKQDGYYEAATGLRWEGLGDPDGLTDLQKTVKSHTDDISDLTEKVSTNTTDVGNLKTKTGSLETTIGTKADNSALTALTTRVTTAEEDIDALQAKDASLQSAIEANSGLIDTNTKAINNLQSKDTELAASIKANADNITLINTELNGAGEDTSSSIKARLTATEKVANTANTTANDAKSTAEAAMPIAGGSFTGAVSYDSTKSIEITGNTQLTTKKYVDDAVSGIGIGNYYTKTEIDNKVETINTNISTAQSAAEAAQDAADAAQADANANAENISKINTTIGTFDSATMGADIVTYIGSVKKVADAAAVKATVDQSIAKLTSDLEAETNTAREAEAANAAAIKKEVETDRDAAIAAAKTALIGTGEGATNTTIKGLEVDIDAQIAAINADLDLVKGKTDDLSTVMNFVGVSTTDPATAVTIDGKSWTPDKGDVIIYNEEEYVYTGTKWEQFGSASASTAAIAELSGQITANKNAIESNDKDITALQKADSDTSSRIDAIDGATGTVAKLTERVAKNETNIAANKKAVEDEAKIARAAEEKNAGDIAAEVTRATGAETTLASDIENLTTQLTWGTF